MKKVNLEKEESKYSQEIKMPSKLVEKLKALQQEREKINAQIDSRFQALIEGFLVTQDVPETARVEYRDDLEILGVLKEE